LAVERIFAGHGLRIFDVERIPTHGGSLRISAGLTDSSSREATPRVGELRDVESRAGLDQVATYERFSETVDAAKQSFRSFLETARDEGKLVAGYGAAAKGNTLLNTVGVDTDLIAYVVDRNPHKQGLFLPGSHIPVHAPEMVLESKPDYLVILPWNLKAEVMDQMSHIRNWGGEFVVAIPETRIA
jgi:hypothetical protein